MDLAAIARDYHANGYVVVRQTFSVDEVAAIESHITALMENHVEAFGEKDIFFEDTPERPIKSMFRLETRDVFFDEFRRDARLYRILAALWPDAPGEPTCGFTSVFLKQARAGSTVPPHQDNGFQNWDPPEALQLTVAVDESTAENGALIVQQGSHQCGLLPHRPSGVLGFSQTLIDPLDTQAYPEVQLCLKPGDIAFHHVNTVHRSEPNRSAQSRRQLVVSYQSSRAKRDIAAYERYQAQLEDLHASKRSS